MTTTVDRIQALVGTVRECLASLDSASPDDPQVGRSFDDLERGFAELGDLKAVLASANDEERVELESALSDLARIHAVLQTAVARDRDKLCTLLERAREAKGALRGASHEGVPGGTLDFSA